MSNQKGSILVTGANGGLGSAIVSRIVSVPDLETYHGIFTVRETESATALDAALGASSSEPGVFQSHEKISLDLSQLGSVREVAAAINARVEAGAVPPISAIILNAGFTEYDTQTWNKDGLDLTFVVNYLAHWLLVLLLLRSMDRERGRIVWISSWSHNPEHPQNIMNGSFKDDSCKTMITDALDPLAKGLWSPTASEKPLWTAAYRRYGASKMCGVAMIHELQRRLDQDPVLSKISVLAIDPGGLGWCARSLVGASVPQWLLAHPQKSARDVLAAALDCGPLPLTEQPKGVYFNGSELGDYNPEAKDPEKGRVIWEGSLRFTQLQGQKRFFKIGNDDLFRLGTLK
ncbi:short-chain dehydrogenase [Apiospora arundinis]